MGKICALAFANIRKGLSQSISLFVLVAISAMLLSVGFVLFFQFGSYFDERADELNAPHVAIVQSESITTDEQERYLASYPKVTETETIPVLSGFGEYYVNDSKTTGLQIFESIKTKQKMNPPLLIGDSLPLDDSSIYVPYLMKVTGGYDLGDDYRVILGGKTQTYTIAGFTEEVMYGSLMNTLYRYYLSDAAYQRLSKDNPWMECSLQQVRLENPDDSLQLEIDYQKEFFFAQESDGASSSLVQTLKIDDAKTARTSIPMIASALMMAFSLILISICLVVIRFRIVNNIEESIHDIGALKAIGYTSRQLIMSIVMQFLSIALFGSIVGLVLAQAMLPATAQMLESQTALVWNPGFSFELSAIVFVLICGIVALTSLIAANRIRKLAPLIALRSGFTTHSFKRNTLPLDATRGPLPLLLALKGLLNKKKQAVMISLIVAFVTFASVASISTYYNIGVEPTEFIKIVAGELPDAGLLLEDSEKTEEVIDHLEDDSRVRSVFGFQDVNLAVDDITVTTIITEDFSRLEGNMLVEGRYPIHDNEVALGGNAAKALDKHIGDTVAVTQGGKTKEYFVTGIIQMMLSGGINMSMTYDGLMHVQSDYKFDQIYIYLNDDVEVSPFLTSVESREGKIFSSVVNMKEMTDAQFSAYGSIFGILTLVIFLVTALVIILVLYMVMKTAILQRKREFGIMKAVGFTTSQLMHQLAFNYLPIILFGVVIGGTVGYFCFNPLFVSLMSGFGILKVELPTPLLWTVAACLLMLALSYIVSLLIALRIRKISPNALISE